MNILNKIKIRIKETLDNTLLKLNNRKAYSYYKKRMNGVITIDCKRGCGYYLIIGVIGINNIGKIETWKAVSGKEVIMKLVRYETFRDPWDMIESSYWHLIGYKNEKSINECTFKEFLDIYAKDQGLIK